jgi:2-amino-4-hydroxy-6-hydroxymethyldihydropteridine diphosphokinase
MSTCLIALGSNLGDRAATLDAAINGIGALAGARVSRHSRWHATQPVGGGDQQPEFLNGAALCEISLAPADLLAALQEIEARHGRERTERWADRTLDLDLLLYDQFVIETPSLTVPHPRMSFRRFVLEPAAEIAGQLVHPTIGRTLEQLLRHLDTGADCLAMVSPEAASRTQLATMLTERCSTAIDMPKLDVGDERLWPAELTTWISIATADAKSHYPTATKYPKLTVLVDPPLAGMAAEDVANWTAICRQHGRGPTLRIRATSEKDMSSEVFAAVQAVWPALGPRSDDRLE